MEEANRSIAESLQNGQYYVDAKNWYLYKYINPFVERNIVILLASFLVMAILIACIFYQSMMDTNPQVDFISKSNDITKNYVVINSLGSKSEDPQLLIEKYMTRTYIKKREEYDYNLVDEQLKFVKNSSSEKVNQVFEYLMGINNPDSPLLLFQKINTRTIEIISMDQDPSEKNTYLIKFNATVASQKDSSREKSSWIAKITYTMSTINQLIADEKKVLDYKVVDYVVQKLN